MSIRLNFTRFAVFFLFLLVVLAGSITQALGQGKQDAKQQNSKQQDAKPQDAKSKEPVAMVGGQPIYDEELAPTVEGQLLSLRNQEYEIKRKALDSLIDQKMLEVAAKKKGLTTEKLLDEEVNSKVTDPSEAEIEGYYYGVKPKGPLADVKPQLKESLKQTKMQQLRQDYMKNLRADSKVVVLLSAPRV